MAAEAPVIIKKKRGGGHAGAHGGAWKVAYADFITALMSLFLVMWLISADEETRMAIADYFNSYTPFGASDSVNNNGRISGGDASNRSDGSQGRFEEKLLERPSQTTPAFLDEQEILNDFADELFDGAAFSRDVEAEHVQLMAPGAVLFPKGSSELLPGNYKYLNRLAEIFQTYAGAIEIQGHASQEDVVGSTKDLPAAEINNEMWLLSFQRAMAVRNYLVQVAKVSPSKLLPVAKYRSFEAEHGGKINKEGGPWVKFQLRHARD